jgi:hypothetical protein
MSVQASALNLTPSLASSSSWRSRGLAILLIVAIGGIFWVDSRYPALLKRSHSGTQKKVGSTHLRRRISRRPWHAACHAGIPHNGQLAGCQPNRDDLFVPVWPAALTFLATLPRRRSNSRYLNTLFGAAAGAPLAVCTNCVAPIVRGL